MAPTLPRRSKKQSSSTSWQQFLLRGLVICILINVYFATVFQEQLGRYLLESSPSASSPGGSEDKVSIGEHAKGGGGGGGSASSVRSDQIDRKLGGGGSSSPPRNDADPQPQSFARYSFDRTLAERSLSNHGRDALFQPLRAYVERPLNDTVPGTIDKGNLNEKSPKKEVGRPSKFYVPLPLREGSPDDLKVFEYGHRLRSCADLPAGLPVDRGVGKHVVPNVQNRRTYNGGELDPFEEAREGCPIHADPFLPWVHDLWPSADGSTVHFVAQNMRRCNSGKVHWKDIVDLQPQVTILQPVSVRRINETEAAKLAPELWRDEEGTSPPPVRYRLAPHEEADSDAQFTRFICRFRALEFSKGEDKPPKLVVVGETLSTYPFNYEFVNYRKAIGDLSMLTPKGKDNPMFWLSQMRFDCPVPDNGDLRSVVASGEGVLSEGTPTLYLDVVPIRTAPRYGKSMSYFTPDMADERLEVSDDKFNWKDIMTTNIQRVQGDGSTRIEDNDIHPPRKMKNGFDARLFWGDRHVLPLIDASGRWSNFPICRHPGLGYGADDESKLARGKHVDGKGVGSGGAGKGVSKKHKLTACLWASASFSTRGNMQAVSDTTVRLVEWIEFHLLVGFDHVYVYDNTGAHTNETSLKSTLFPRFLDSEVTRIDWPSRVCNNNIPAHESTGERSSQYAAENSCRARYGPYTEWMATFDTDEYLIPMGKYPSMVEVVDDAFKQGRQILTFMSTRAPPRYESMEPFHAHKDCGNKTSPNCLRVRPGNLFVEDYNCDFNKPPKPQWSERAKKQLYRPEYVLSHFVHYATVTNGLNQTKAEAEKRSQSWNMQFREQKTTDQRTDEINQAVMLHSKTTVPEYTTDWKRRCKEGVKPAHGENCRIGFPWPDNNDGKGRAKANPEGYGYNCFTNERLTNVWIPKLREVLKKREETLKLSTVR